MMTHPLPIANKVITNTHTHTPTGQDVVDLMTKQFYSGTNAVIYVYDVTNDRSLYDADVWLKDLEIYLTQDLHNGIPILFVRNKLRQTEFCILPYTLCNNNIINVAQED